MDLCMIRIRDNSKRAVLEKFGINHTVGRFSHLIFAKKIHFHC